MYNVAFNGFSSPQVKKNTPRNSRLDFQKGNVHYLNRDVVQFKGQDRLSKFSRLGEWDKHQIKEAYKYIYQEEKQWLHAALGKKPSALVSLPPEYAEVLMAYRDIVLPENLAIVKLKRSTPHTRNLPKDNLYIINIPETTKVVEKNLDYFRKRLNDGDMTVNDVVKRLTEKDSPLADMENNADIAGIVLGFPFGDSLVFRLYYEAKSMCESIQDRADQTQKQILSTVMQLLRQDVEFNECPYTNQVKATSRKEPLHMAPSGIPEPHLHPGIRSLYQYYSWEGDSPRNRAFSHKIEADVQATNSFFDSDEKFIHYMLVTEVY